MSRRESVEVSRTVSCRVSSASIAESAAFRRAISFGIQLHEDDLWTLASSTFGERSGAECGAPAFHVGQASEVEYPRIARPAEPPISASA